MGMKQDRIRKGWRDWLAANHRGWRIFVGAVCAVGLFLFLHFREVRTENLELHSTAPRTVIAPIDFESVDYETTTYLKQQAMEDVGRIYQLDDAEIRAVRHEFEEGLLQGSKWRSRIPSATFEEMYKVADAMETLLLEMRFTDPRTLQVVRSMRLPDSAYIAWMPEEEGKLPDDFWAQISKRLEMTFASPQVAYAIASFSSFSWSLVRDPGLEHSLQASLARSISPKYVRVRAGEKILHQGDTVTSRHVTLLSALRQALFEHRKLHDPLQILSTVLISLIFVTISALYFRISQMNFIRSLREIALFVTIVLISLCLAKSTEYVLLHSASTLLEAVRYPLLAPFATILICILLSPRTALFAATFLSIILSVSLAVEHTKFLLVNLVASIVVIIYSRGIRRRKEIFAVCFKSWLSTVPLLYAFLLSENLFWSSQFLVDVGMSLLFLLATAVLVVGILPALEILFGIVTDMMLIEYLDPSSELLREFATLVPGTYQHSLVVGNMAETCATSIGANGLFCRVATLYHDIGKMRNPQFYTENQGAQVNIHNLLTPSESAEVIIAHVLDGEEIARKYRLPESFIDIIRQHHGTTLVYYFYRKELDKKGEIEEAKFRYPGPKPQTKEAAIVMICDTVEAASRSLEQVDAKSLTEIVDRLVQEKAEDGQFDECQLTFEELHRVKKTLVDTLLFTHHVRVKYPKRG